MTLYISLIYKGIGVNMSNTMREDKIVSLINQISKELSSEEFQRYDEIKKFLSMGNSIKQKLGCTSKYKNVQVLSESVNSIRINNYYDAVIKKILPYGLLARLSISSSSDILVFCVKKGKTKFKVKSKIRLKIVKNRRDIKVPFAGEILDNKENLNAIS